MKFQILDEEGNPETFEKLPKSLDDIQPRFYFDPVRNQTIEQCAQIADRVAIESQRNQSKKPVGEMFATSKESYWEGGKDIAKEIARQIHALITSPQPEPHQNITQEQTVIAALIEACRMLLENVLQHHREKCPLFCNPDAIKQGQDALALADTLTKGGSRQ